MGRFLRSRWLPLGLGIVLFLSAVLIRREVRPRKSARPRGSGEAVRIASSNSEMPETEHLLSSSSFRVVEGGEGDDVCTAACDRFEFLSLGEDVAAYFAASNDWVMIIEADYVWDPVTSDTLEKDLELTPPQKARIDDLRARYKSEEELWRNHSLLESEVDRKLEELQERYRALIRWELSPEQQRKYDELDAGTLRGHAAALYSRALERLEADLPDP